jgi:ApeA N-terminal domain 1
VIEELQGVKQSGKFRLVGSGKDVHGELTLAGSKTSIYLQDDDFFDAFPKPRRCITGVLLDLTRVTLIDCITMSGTGNGSRGGEQYHFASLFPHFVLYGDRHIIPNEPVITAVDFVIDDATTLFYDFDAFGSVLDARPYIDQIARANRLSREIPTGPEPQIIYFTGKRRIFSANTILGQITASHNPIHNIGGSNGVHLRNTISVTVEFGEPVLFDEAMTRTSTLSNYLGILVGRPQNILNLAVRVVPEEDSVGFLRVYWTMPPRRDEAHEGRTPHPRDVLMDAVREPDAFADVLASWLQVHAERHEARGRFFGCFADEHYYTIDRLVAAANMFDILPASAVPPDVSLSEEQVRARDDARKLFRALSQSAERDSVLSALGRMGKSSLKHKIRHRAKIVLQQAEKQFPELEMVCDESVNCRNFYVHGTEPVFDYEAHSEAKTFFTETLEWVFAASELIEAGWNIGAWLKRGSSMSNPFARYHINYGLALQELKKLLPAVRQASAG